MPAGFCRVPIKATRVRRSLIKVSTINDLPDGVFSPADILENASSASGKFGGVAGVLHGVICKRKNSRIEKRTWNPWRRH